MSAFLVKKFVLKDDLTTITQIIYFPRKLNMRMYQISYGNMDF